MAEVCMIIGCANDTFAQRQRKADAAEPSAEFSTAAEHLCSAHQADWLLSPECNRVDPLESEIEEAIELGRYVERLSAQAGKPDTQPPEPKKTTVCEHCRATLTIPSIRQSWRDEKRVAEHTLNCPWAAYWRKPK